MGMKIFITNISAVFLTVICLSAQDRWVENTFEDFRDGQFLDAGSNLYVSAKGRMQMITRWDLNNDGFLDIVLPAGHAHTEKENVYIYLNNGTDIDGHSLIQLPGGGACDGLVIDLNKDGFNDIVVANNKDSHVGDVNTWVYYGAASGFNPKKKLELPAPLAEAVEYGDFNDDDWPDLVIACNWRENNSEQESQEKSLIYLNSASGFTKEKKIVLDLGGGRIQDVAVADLDNDRKSDLVFVTRKNTFVFSSAHNDIGNTTEWTRLAIPGEAVSVGNFNKDKYKDIAICNSGESFVLEGTETGFNQDNRISLHKGSGSDVEFVDVNQDGFDDVIVAVFATPGGATWTNSMIYLSNGKGFDTENPIKLPTIGATAINAADLNGDKFPELVVSNMRVTNQNDMLSYVYWNRNGRYVFGDHSQLRTRGTLGNTIGDVNNDGLKDVVFFGDEGGFRDGASKSHIYWGDGTRNFSIEHRTTFDTHQMFGCAHADLDDDNNVDLILAQSGFITGVSHEQNGVNIYWNRDGRFDLMTNLSMITAYGGMRVADINKDGYLDMVVGGACIDPEDPTKIGFPIFWGSEKGFMHQARSVLHIEGRRIRGQLLMDLNRDGWLDIAGQVVDGKFKIWWGSESGYKDEIFTEFDLGHPDHLMYIKGADFNKDGWLDLLLPHRGPPDGKENTSFIYYGSPDGYSNENRIEIKSYVPYQNSIADFDRDGWLDIFLTSYGGEVSGNRPALLYWGSESGFETRPRLELPSYGSSGSESVDYDGDGWIDLFLANHRHVQPPEDPGPHRHTTYSMLYWGGPQGFSPEHRWEVLAQGPSGLNLRDAGNSYDRGLYEDYISSSCHIPTGKQVRTLGWLAETPFKTQVLFQVRAAEREDDLSQATWIGPDGKNTWFVNSGSQIPKIKGEWIQYRARFVSPNGGPTPYLTEVSVLFK